MTERREIYCAGCETKVVAKLINGQEAYPHRQDLFPLPFWKCDDCGNFVGCHWKTKDRTRPLGCIPTPELKNARREIHKILDPIWKNGGTSRTRLYKQIAKRIGRRKYHTAQIRSIEEARQVYRIVRELATAQTEQQ